MSATGGDGELVPYFPRDEGDDALKGIAYIAYARQSGGMPAFRRGLSLLDRALSDTPGAGEAQFLLGFARLQTGDARGALAPLRASVEAGANPERLNTLAQAIEASGGSAAEAERLYREALGIQPAASEIRVNLGRLLEAQGRVRDAIAQYRAAIEEEPWLVEAHTLLGGALAKSGEIAGAIAELREAITLDPGQADALTNLAALLAQQGQIAEAGRFSVARWTQILATRTRRPTSRSTTSTGATRGRLDGAQALQLDPASRRRSRCSASSGTPDG